MKKIFGFLTVGIFFAFFIYFITCYVRLPNYINVTEGIIHEFSFKMPLEATIYPENIGVMQINNKPADSNITVSLSEPLSIEATESGQATMTFNAFGVPLKKIVLDVAPIVEVIPCGMTIGVKISTEGIMVLGLGSVNGEDGSSHKPSEGILKSGDLILIANGEDLESKDQFIKIIEKCDDKINLKLRRDNELIDALITPVKSTDDNKKKIGVWVRDSTQGIGTVTYYNPSSGKFGALGHGILDVDTKRLMSVKSGEIRESEIVSVKKGQKGSPGELVGEIKRQIIGDVKVNTQFGIYGSMFGSPSKNFIKEKMRIALQSEIHEGPATILSNITGQDIKEYDVYIESVNRHSSDDSKGLVVKITDPDLLSKTNGIVQGMSGSPIIQDGKLIGAITHVFVQDPTKGYGIFIENMLKYESEFEHSI